MLGRSRAGAFLRVTVPMARPALVAGVALAMMEALADFGTVASFGYRTLTEAIYRVWYGMFDRIAATQLASVLLLFAAGLLLLERAFARPRPLHPERPARAGGGAGAPRRVAGRRRDRRVRGRAHARVPAPGGPARVVGARRDPRGAGGARLRRAALAHLRARGRRRRGGLPARGAAGLRGPAARHRHRARGGPARLDGLRAAGRGDRGGGAAPARLGRPRPGALARARARPAARAAAHRLRGRASSSPTWCASSRWACRRWTRASARSRRASTTRRGSSAPGRGRRSAACTCRSSGAGCSPRSCSSSSRR